VAGDFEKDESRKFWKYMLSFARKSPALLLQAFSF